MSKTEVCNKCASVGFPNQLIGFKKSTRINPATNKVFWDLINEDGSEHIHKQNGLDTPTKTPQNSQLVIDNATVVKTLETPQRKRVSLCIMSGDRIATSTG